MNKKQQIKKSLKEYYPLIPMSEITHEARIIAVAWVEGYQPMGTINLEQKHKLASDIMNYARHYSQQEISRLKAENERMRKALQELVDLKDYKDVQGKSPEYLNRQPLAWEQARKFLSSTHQQPVEEQAATFNELKKTLRQSGVSVVWVDEVIDALKLKYRIIKL